MREILKAIREREGVFAVRIQEDGRWLATMDFPECYGVLRGYGESFEEAVAELEENWARRQGGKARAAVLALSFDMVEGDE